MTSRDDDGLRWDGDDDPTLHATPEVEPDAASAPADEPDPAAEEPSDEAPAEPDPAPARGGSVALVAYGVLGGVYALWTVGWILGTLRLRDWIETATETVADVMFRGSMVLAIAAPALWFLTTLAATRRKRAWQRFLWLGAGVVLLIPWPFVMVGVIGR
ncbi:DNA polymerase III subunit gamma/tau [Microbacterium karelineae]|uniref:DNA polymerase III subunit gamma/tau n=1 Tax=Microbacterium karelineae TaxID=2654283 RepID=UPI0012E9F829|nr:DNA polymerase III subunit gamma/tau [Microbacterium karelineae]